MQLLPSKEQPTKEAMTWLMYLFGGSPFNILLGIFFFQLYTLGHLYYTLGHQL